LTVAVGVCVGVDVGVKVGVNVAVNVAVAVDVGEGVLVNVDVAVGVDVGGTMVSVGGILVSVGGTGVLVTCTEAAEEHAETSKNSIKRGLIRINVFIVCNTQSPFSILCERRLAMKNRTFTIDRQATKLAGEIRAQ
jgi:hypothetical protein